MKRWFEGLLGVCVMQPLFAVNVLAVEVTESTPVYVAPNTADQTVEAPAPSEQTQVQQIEYLTPEEEALMAEDDDVEDFGIVVDDVEPAAGQLADDRQLLVQELQSLRETVERQQRQIDDLKEKNKSLYQDLDRRLQAMAQKLVAVETRELEDKKAELANRKAQLVPTQGSGNLANATSAAQGVSSSDETKSSMTAQQRYANAKSILDEGGRDTKAAIEFRKLLLDHPDTPLKPNIYYWLAQIYKRSGETEKAESFYNKVLEEFPGSIKAASSLASLSAMKSAQGENDQAQALKQKLLTDYPNSAEAKKLQN
jgi:TolA-binding protein